MSSFSQSDIVFRLNKIVTGFVTPSRRAAQTEKPHKTPLIIPPCGLRLCVSINASCLILHTVVFVFVYLLCLVLCFFMAFYVFCTSLWSFCLSMTSFFGQFLSHFGVWVILRLNLVVFFCSSVLHLLFELMFVLVFFCNCFTHFNFLSHYFIHLHVFIWQLTLVSVWLFDV